MQENWPFNILWTAALVATVTSERCRPNPDNDIPKKCPMFDPVNTTVKIAHEWDCRKFYVCFEGYRFLLECPSINMNERLYFNPSLQSCDWRECTGCNYTDLIPHHSDCSKYHEVIDDETITKSCPWELHFNPVSKTCVPQSEAGCYTPKCEGFGNSTVLADMSDCSKYFSCHNGQKVHNACPDGMYFHKVSGDCVEPETATCDHPLLLPDDTSCSRYKMIDNHTVITKQCPHGMYFSPGNKTCVPPLESGCQPLGVCSSLADGMIVPDKSSCDKYFLCVDGEAILQKCPEGRYIDKFTIKCVDPEFATCKWPILIPDRENCSRYQEIFDDTVITEECPSGLYFSAANQTCMPPADAACQLRGPCDGMTDGTAIADRSDCGKYFVCRDGQPVSEECPEGRYFNKIWGACVVPEFAGCPDPILTPYEPNCSKYYKLANDRKSLEICPGNLHFSPTNRTCMPPSESGCQPHGPCDGIADGGSVPAENSCSKYLRCRHGKPYSWECPDGHHFSKTSQTCVAPAIADCKYTTVTPHNWNCSKYHMIIRDRKVIEDCPRGLYFSTTNKTCVPPSESGCQPRGPCDGVANGTSVADEASCRKYFVCLNGNAVSEDCPEGLHFDETWGRCVASAIAGCSYTMYAPYHGDCSKFYKIIGGRKILEICPNELHFGFREKTCVPPSEAGCQLMSGMCDDVTNGTMMADKSNCTKYFLCLNGEPLGKHCPGGLYWNNITDSCVKPEFTTCNSPVKVPGIENCSKYQEIVGNKFVTRECPDGLHFSSTRRSCLPPVEAYCGFPEGQCYDVADGDSVADIDNCDKYFSCINGEAVPRKCPKNRYFNKIWGICVAPQAAGCHYPILVPHQGDCSKYLEIANHTIMTKNCPRGLEFSSTRKICVSPAKAGCQYHENFTLGI